MAIHGFTSISSSNDFANIQEISHGSIFHHTTQIQLHAPSCGVQPVFSQGSISQLRTPLVSCGLNQLMQASGF